MSWKAMYLLDYLRNPRHWPRQSGGEAEDTDDLAVEYRLICSGSFYPAHFLGDWSRSDNARILLDEPVLLLVASRPYERYPQELSLRFTLSSVTETKGIHSSNFHPDDEIASDLASLLTLLTRRLITVSVKTRERYLSFPPGPFPKPPDFLMDYPIPLVTEVKKSYWSPRPIELCYGRDGVTAKSYEPPIEPFDTSWIMNVLRRLPSLPQAEAIVRAARRYTLAMEIIEQQPEISYQLLISVIETLARNAELRWAPTEAEKLQLSSSQNVLALAKSKQLDKELAKCLALAAAEHAGWSGERFKAFILENVKHDDLKEKDSLFCVPLEFCPSPDDYVSALTRIYRMRGSASHGGHPYPESGLIGQSPRMSYKAFSEIMSGQSPFPPVTWFERIVSSSVRSYLRSQEEQARNASVAAHPPDGSIAPTSGDGSSR